MRSLELPSASEMLVASSTAFFIASRAIRKVFRMFVSSSTIRIRIFGFVSCPWFVVRCSQRFALSNGPGCCTEFKFQVPI